MPRKSREPVGSCRLALAMSCTTGSCRTLWQLASAWARSASSSRCQTQMPYASVGGGVAQRHARSEA
eukprot:2080324-Prymnesium_polylepis.1